VVVARVLLLAFCAFAASARAQETLVTTERSATLASLLPAFGHEYPNAAQLALAIEFLEAR
jgi:hypothetical protein